MRILVLITTLVTLFGALLPASSVSDSTFNLQSTSKPTFPGFCKRLNKHVKQCLRGRHFRNKASLACDRVEEALQLLCGTREVILAPRSADSSVIDLLRRDYKIVPLEDAVFPYNHIVIEALDLQDPDIIDLLRKAHRAGKTVAIATATEEQVRRFHGLVRTGEDSDCKDPGNPDGLIQLYGLQQSINPSMVGSYCMRNVNHRDPQSDRRWLRDRFDASVPGNLTPVPLGIESDQQASPLAPSALSATAAPEQLTSLATGKTCSYIGTDALVGTSSWDVQVWGMRSFASTTDYYLVNFNPTMVPSVSNINFYQVNSLTLSEVEGLNSESIITNNTGTPAIIIDTDPQSDSAFISSYENDSSTTVDGSIGLSAEKGPDVEGGGSVTVGNSTTTDVPPVTIENVTDLISLEPNWIFTPQSTTTGSGYQPMSAWTWQLPMDTYPLGGTATNQISFTPGANIFSTTNNSTFLATCNVTVPFPVWEIETPTLTSLTPTSAGAGSTVMVVGQFLYPGILTSVLIGGTSIPSSNLDLVSSTELKITLPPGLLTGTQKVQVTTNGTMELTSNTLTLDVN